MPHSVVTNSIKFAKLPFLLIEMPKTVLLLKIKEPSLCSFEEMILSYLGSNISTS